MPPCLILPCVRCVALLAEGVDRNTVGLIDWQAETTVALLAEGVDRNEVVPDDEMLLRRSPSSRRAWIEIQPNTPPQRS